MKTVTIQISDLDYEELVRHFAEHSAGRLLVAVVGLPALEGSLSLLEADIETAKLGKEKKS